MFANLRDTPELFGLFLTVKTITKLKLEHGGKFEIQAQKFSRQRRIWSGKYLILHDLAHHVLCFFRHLKAKMGYVELTSTIRSVQIV